MKVITITFTRQDKRATCLLHYWEPEWPINDGQWFGDEDAFQLEDGSLLSPAAPLDELAGYLARLAAEAGAEFTIEDDGGEVMHIVDHHDLRLEAPVDAYYATFKKGKYEAICDLRYWGGADEPMMTEWEGDENAFYLPDGSPLKLGFPQEALERELASQAELIGAEFSLEHERFDGGRAAAE